MRARRLLPVMVALAVALAVGDVAAAAPRSGGGAAEAPGRVARRAPNTPPRLPAPVTVEGHVGETTTVVVPVVDGEGDEVAASVSGPDGLSVLPNDRQSLRLHWAPSVTGAATAVITLTDEHGAWRTGRLRLRATNPPTPDTLMGLGDSVASGHGLQKRDYLQGDGCWRSEDEAYPALVHEQLVERGVLGADGAVHLVACSGATLADVLTDPVTGGPVDLAPASGRRTQVDWAVAVNPEVVTLTAGANTLGFTDAWNVLADGELDDEELARRLRRVEIDLRAVLSRLVDHTDSLVVVTNYYNPAARDPQGVDGCEGDCFARRSAEVVDRLDESISAVTAEFSRTRVVRVDLIEAFDGHGAPNGLGPDRLRSGASGWFRSLVGAPFEGVHPYCADGHDDAGSWINYVDCVHPDGRGHREIADLVAGALD